MALRPAPHPRDDVAPSQVRAQLKAKGGSGFDSAETLLCRALGVMHASDSEASVSAVAFASLFTGGAKYKDLVDALGSNASAAAAERLVKVRRGLS